MRTVQEAYLRSAQLAQHLEPVTAELAYYLLYEAWIAGVPLAITSGLRNEAEQGELVREGRSRTMRSKHLVGRAFDVDVLGIGRDQVPRWWWEEVGQVAERLGLQWGGRWGWDFGHFETP